MAQVEIQAGPHRFVSLMSREAADELGLEPGVLAVAAVKSTNVVVEVPGSRASRPEPADRAVPLARAPPSLAVAVAAVRLARRLRLERADVDRRVGVDAERAAITGTITVFAAASLTEAFTDARQAVRGRPPGHQGRVQLRPELGPGRRRSPRAHRPTCSPRPARRTWTRSTDAGDAADADDFVKNVMEIAVPPANPAKITARRRPGQAGRQGGAVPGRRCRAARSPRRCSPTPSSR